MNALEKLLDRYFLGKFLKHNSTKKIATNTIWLSSDRIIKMVLGILVGLGVAKHLGPIAYGKISYGMLYFSFFLPLATMALDSLIVRDLSRRAEQRERILGSVALIRLTGSILAFGLSVSTVIFLQPEQPLIWTIVIINTSLFVLQSFEGCDLVFQTQLKSKYSTYSRTLNYLIFSGIKLYFIYQKAELMAFVWVYAFELFFNTIFLILVYQWKIGDILKWRPDKEIISNWMRESPFLVLQTFLILIQGRADQFMLEKILDIKSFGEYSLAARLIEMTYFLPVAIAASSAPRISDAKINNEELYQTKLKNLYKLMIILFFVMATPIALLGKITIDTFFEGKFENAGLIFVLLSSRLIYLNIGVVKSFFFLNENLVKYSMWYTIIGIIINLSANYFLIPRFHVFGAIISMNISSFTTTFLLDWFSKSMRKNILIFLDALKDILLFRNWRMF